MTDHLFRYMIDNIILLITGTLRNRPIAELLPRCHPLGRFDELATISIATSPAELFNAVMVDTPLAPFFSECVQVGYLPQIELLIAQSCSTS